MRLLERVVDEVVEETVEVAMPSIVEMLEIQGSSSDMARNVAEKADWCSDGWVKVTGRQQRKGTEQAEQGTPREQEEQGTLNEEKQEGEMREEMEGEESTSDHQQRSTLDDRRTKKAQCRDDADVRQYERQEDDLVRRSSRQTVSTGGSEAQRGTATETCT